MVHIITKVIPWCVSKSPFNSHNQQPKSNFSPQQNLHFAYVLMGFISATHHRWTIAASAQSSCSEVLDLNPDADKQKIRRRFSKLVVPW
jgi:hypothetical protein